MGSRFSTLHTVLLPSYCNSTEINQLNGAGGAGAGVARWEAVISFRFLFVSAKSPIISMDYTRPVQILIRRDLF